MVLAGDIDLLIFVPVLTVEICRDQVYTRESICFKTATISAKKEDLVEICLIFTEVKRYLIETIYRNCSCCASLPILAGYVAYSAK